MQALACKQKQLRGRLCQNVSDLHLVSASLHARQVDLQSETLKAGKVHEQALRHAKLLQECCYGRLHVMSVFLCLKAYLCATSRLEGAREGHVT